MKYTTIISLLVGFSAVASFAAETVLVDTDFSAANSDGTLQEEQKAGIPLKLPTQVSTLKDSASRILSGKEKIGALEPPYAEIETGGKSGAADQLGDAMIVWNLASEGLKDGRYELTFRLTPLSDDVPGGRVAVNFRDDVQKTGAAVHQALLPVQVVFTGNRLRVGQKKLPIIKGQTLAVKLQFDLDTRVWSAWVDNEQILADKPFPAKLADSSIPLGVMSISTGSKGGMDEKVGAHYAISAVRLVQLAK